MYRPPSLTQGGCEDESEQHLTTVIERGAEAGTDNIDRICHFLMNRVLTMYLVEGDDVDAAAEADVFGVEAEDAHLLEALLSKGVVGR